MSRADTSTTAGPRPAIRHASERGNIVRLAVAQALAGANSTVIYATGAVIGETLAPTPALATLPISLFVVGMAAGTCLRAPLPSAKDAARHS
jgi:hypothetical protein